MSCKGNPSAEGILPLQYLSLCFAQIDVINRMKKKFNLIAHNLFGMIKDTMQI
jgi:hypothetical protein